MRHLAYVALISALTLVLIQPVPAAATSGDRLWVARYDGRTTRGDAAAAIAVSPDGSRVFVTGNRSGAATSDYATAAYDAATGAELWVQRYGSKGRGNDRANAIGVSPDGTKVFVTGTGQGVGSYSILTVAYDANTGAKSWARRYTGPAGASEGNALSVSPDGARVYVAGDTFRVDTGPGDYSLVAYDADTGTRAWARRYDGPIHGFDEALALAVNPDTATIYATGRSTSSTGLDYATVAFEATTGAKVWSRRYDGETHAGDTANAVSISPDGDRLFVTGESEREGRSFDYATVAYDADTGTQLWAARYDGPTGGNDLAYSVAPAPDGNHVFVTGVSIGATSSDAATVAYDAATGAVVWTRRYDGPANLDDAAQRVAVTPDGTTVCLTGYSASVDGADDFLTVTLRAGTGALVWAKRYDGPAGGLDRAAGLALSPDGAKAFVTGISLGLSSYDYATVAYSIG